MQNGLTTLWNLFDGSRIIKVPNYQRAFTWEEKNINDFLDDIQNQSNYVDEKKYFMGTLLFQNADKEGNFEKYFIVDGQQRLTTVVIYLNELLKKIRNHEYDFIDEFEAFVRKRDNLKFQTIDSDNSFFSDYIINENDPIDFETTSQKRLNFAKDYFKKYVNNQSKENLIKHLEVIKNTQILIYIVKDSIEATLIFETTNDRGKRLTNLEALKSFLMHKAYLSSDDPLGLIHEIEGHFAVLYREYEKIEDYIDEDDILRYFYIAEWEWTSKVQYQNVRYEIKKIFNELINNGEREECVNLIRKHVRILKEYFEKMRMLVKNEISSDHLNDLKAIGRIATFYPILLKSFCTQDNPNFEKYQKIIHLCEIFAFKGYGLANKRADTGLPYFYECARDFNGGYAELFDWIKNALSWWKIPQAFKDTLNSPYFYYEGSDARYLLWKYENSLRKKAGYTLLSAHDYMERKKKTAFSIEHIAAQKGEEVKKCLLEIKVDGEYEENYLHHVGNLAIDPLSSNIKKGKLAFKGKYKFFNKAPLMSHNELEDIAQLYNGWNVDAIRDRANRIIKFAEENWNENDI